MRWFLWLFSLCFLGCAASIPEPAPARPMVKFLPAETPEETRGRIDSLPDADIWTHVTGTHMGWLHRNVNKVFPTVTVYRDGPVRELAKRPMREIARFPVQTPGGEMAFEDFLFSDQSTVMGLVILYRGERVFEAYPRQQYYEKPIFWSVAKSLVSTLVAILEDRGQVDVNRGIDEYIPELKSSAWQGIRIRNILDMATGVDCPENYDDPYSCYYAYSQSIGEGHVKEDSPDNPYTYLAGIGVGRFAEQGTSYEYSGVNTFLLSWLVESITGMQMHDFFTQEIWLKIGSEADAAFLAPRFGVPNPSGGFMSRLRDLARFGLLFTPSWSVVSGEKIISERYLQTILHGGNPALLENARGAPAGKGRPENVKHNVYQWDAVYTNHDFMKGGWGGQGLLINPEKDLVAAWTGYFKDDDSQVSLLPVLREVLGGVFPDYSRPETGSR